MVTDTKQQLYVIQMVNLFLGATALDALRKGLTAAEMLTFTGLLESGLVKFSQERKYPTFELSDVLNTCQDAGMCTSGCGLRVSECINPHHCSELTTKPERGYREVKNYEWMGLAGAEAWERHRPLIMYFNLPMPDGTDQECQMVADATGMCWSSDLVNGTWSKRAYVSDDTFAEATMVLRILDDVMTSGQYTEQPDIHNILAYLGFEA